MNTPTNAVVIVIDALRADRVGAIGASDRSLTPTIDELATDGAVFPNAFTTVNTTEAAVTSLHTGHYPRATVFRHAYRVTETERRRVAAASFLPEALTDAGYDTVAVAPALGRWNRRGFDTFVGAGGPTSRLKQTYWRLKQRAPRTANAVRWIYARLSQLGGRTADQTSRDPHEITVDGTELLDHITERPFYGFVRLVDTHIPYDPAESIVEELLSRYDYPEGDLRSVIEEAPSGGFLDTAIRPMLTERDFEVGLPRLCARYDAAVVEVDDKIATIRRRLQEIGRWENTALIVTADHGESLFEHGIYADHHGLYDETMHVPLIVRTPGTTGSVHEDLVQIPDIAPTVASILDESIPFDGYGESLQPLWQTGTGPNRNVVFAEETWAQRRFAVRSPRFKLIGHLPDESLPGDGLTCRYCEVSHDDPPMLFDLETDPRETRNVIGDHQAVSIDLRERYEQLLEELPTLEGEDAADYEDEAAVLDHLEALGYQ